MFENGIFVGSKWVIPAIDEILIQTTRRTKVITIAGKSIVK
jgi:hypothetical protein